MIPGAIRPIIDRLMQARRSSSSGAGRESQAASPSRPPLLPLQKFLKGQDATLLIVEKLVPASDAGGWWCDRGGGGGKGACGACKEGRAIRSGRAANSTVRMPATAAGWTLPAFASLCVCAFKAPAFSLSVTDSRLPHPPWLWQTSSARSRRARARLKRSCPRSRRRRRPPSPRVGQRRRRRGGGGRGREGGRGRGRGESGGEITARRTLPRAPRCSQEGGQGGREEDQGAQHGRGTARCRGSSARACAPALLRRRPPPRQRQQQRGGRW